MAYKKGDEKGYFVKVLAGMAIIALLGSLFAYSLGADNSAVENELEVGNSDGASTVDPGDGPFPTTPPPINP